MLNGLTKETFRAVLMLAAVAAAGAHAAAQTPAATKTLRAHRITAPVRVDGVLDDEAWRQADAIDDFVQQDPHVNEPASERTEVRVLVDREAVYFGFVCHDSLSPQPSRCGTSTE